MLGPPLTIMRINQFRAILNHKAVVLAAVMGLCRPALAQELTAKLLLPEVVQPTPVSANPLVTRAQPASVPEARPHRRFWDRENTFLFATSAAFSAADFVVTRDNLRNGGQELNPVTRVLSGSTPGLAVNFAGETAGVVGLSYFFHKTGHHKMERYVSMLNIGSSAAAVTFDMAHR
jgi:hypothetical protein